MAPKGGLLPVQNQMYSSMAEALLKGMVPPPHKERSAVRRLEAGELPKLRGNEFYAESRWFYKAPEEPSMPLCTACVECPLLNPAKCDFKCYSCAKFDPLRKGFFCGACFKARHPPYRQAHTFLPIGEVEDLEGAAKAQRVRAEMDHRIVAIEQLISSVSNTRGTIKDQIKDPLPKELMTAGRIAVDIADTDVHRLRRKLRDDIATRELIAKGNIATAKEAFDLSSSGWNREHIPNRARKLTPAAFEKLLAGNVVTRAYRVRQAKRYACRRAAQIYTKSWSEEEDKWFFVNTKTKTSSWSPPKILKGDISYLNTPRTFERKRRNGEHELERIYKPLASIGENKAAFLLQGAWRRKRARKQAMLRASRIYQRVLDPSSNKYYYFNTLTGLTSWKRPVCFATKMEAESVIQTPRAFAIREKAIKLTAKLEQESKLSIDKVDIATKHRGIDDTSSNEKNTYHSLEEGGSVMRAGGSDTIVPHPKLDEDSEFNSSNMEENRNKSLLLDENQIVGTERDGKRLPDKVVQKGDGGDMASTRGFSEEEGSTTTAGILPNDWEEYLDEYSGHVYYHNVVTGETSWDFPRNKDEKDDGSVSSGEYETDDSESED